MSNLDKKEKVLLILEKVKKDGITAYDLSKKLSISESGLNKLFRGEIKNPHNSTVSALYEHLFEKEIVKEDENKVTIEGHTFKIPIISLAILENREKFLKDRAFNLLFQDLVNQGVRQILEENGIKVMYKKIDK